MKKIKLHISSKIKYTTLLFILILFFSNCRKDNYENEIIPFDKTSILTDFFKILPNEDQEIKSLAENLKKQDSLFNFLPNFIAKNGIPVWDKVLYNIKTVDGNINNFSSNNEKANDMGIFIIPLVDEKTNNIKSYIVVKKHGINRYAYQLYNRKELGKTIVKDDLKENLIQTQAVFGYFENKINGKNDIEISNPKKTKIKDVKISFETDTKKINNNGNVVNSIICSLTISIKISFIDFTDGSVMMKTETTISLYCYDNGGGGSTGGGNTGGSTGGGTTTTYPNDPYRNGNWWDYGAGYPDPYAPRFIIDPYDPTDPFRPYPYDPFMPWFPGGGSTRTIENEYRLTVRDLEIINEIEAEDLEADNNISPCKGTVRSGNIQWAGTLEHWIIQFDYVNSVFGAEREYSIPGSSINGNRGYADIVNLVTNEIFEIKPPTLTLAGAAEVNTYVTKANENCVTANGGQWSKGTSYPTKFFLNPKNPVLAIRVSLDEPGLIVYRDVFRSTNPISAPVALPQNLAIKLKDFLQSLLQNPSNMNEKILVFIQSNPGIKTYIRSAAAGIIIATLVEDIVTGGVGVTDDWASFLIARNMWRAAAKI